MRGISGCCDADRYQHRNKKLLFNVGRRDPLQIQPSINRTNNRVGVPDVVAAAQFFVSRAVSPHPKSIYAVVTEAVYWFVVRRSFRIIDGQDLAK
jgi:hypothetical protein